MHQSMINLSDQYYAERKRVVYITPTVFTQMFNLFDKLLRRKNDLIEDEAGKYDKGVTKLDEAKELIVEMNATLEKLEPQLAIKKKEVDQMMAKLTEEAKLVQERKEIVDEQTKQAQEQEAEAKLLAEDCERELTLAKPGYEKAKDALNTLKAADFVEMKKY